MLGSFPPELMVVSQQPVYSGRRSRRCHVISFRHLTPDVLDIRYSIGRMPTLEESLSHAGLWGPIWVGSASVSCDRLPKLDTISFRIGDPAKLSKIVAFAFWIDRDTFVYQTVQHSIEVIHLEVDHCFLCRREVCIVLFEKGEDDLSVLRRRRKRESSVGLHQTEMPLVPLIQSLWIIRSQKYTAKAGD